jgi:hypothetical protein
MLFRNWLGRLASLSGLMNRISATQSLQRQLAIAIEISISRPPAR